MPTLPIFNHGETVKTRAPERTALNPNVRGVSIDTGALFGAVNMPTLDASGAIAQGRAGAAIGAAVSGAGEVMGKMALAQAHAVNVYKIGEANAKMLDSQAELEAVLAKEKDETKWAGIASEHYAATKSALLKEDLSPVAREEIESNHLRWSAGGLGQVKVASAKHSFARAGDQYGSNYLNAVAAKDVATAQALARKMGEEGYIPKDRATAMELEAPKRVEAQEKRDYAEFVQKQADSLDEAIYAAPENTGRDLMMQDENGNYLFATGLKFEERENFVKKAKARTHELQMGEYENVVGAIDSRDISTHEKLDAFVEVGAPRLSETQLRALHLDIDQRNNPEISAKLANDAPENAMKLWREARDYKPTGDPEKDAEYKADFKHRVSMLLPKGQREDAVDRLELTLNPQRGNIDTDYNTQIHNFTKDVMDAGVWGQWESMARDEKGRLKLDADGKEQKIVNHDVFRKADASRTDLVQKLQDIVKKTPNITSGKLLEEGRRLLGKDAAKMAAPVLLPAPDPLPLPSNSGIPEDTSIYNMLIPQSATND